MNGEIEYRLGKLLWHGFEVRRISKIDEKTLATSFMVFWLFLQNSRKSYWSYDKWLYRKKADDYEEMFEVES